MGPGSHLQAYPRMDLDTLHSFLDGVQWGGRSREFGLGPWMVFRKPMRAVQLELSLTFDAKTHRDANGVFCFCFLVFSSFSFCFPGAVSGWLKGTAEGTPLGGYFANCSPLVVSEDSLGRGPRDLGIESET